MNITWLGTAGFHISDAEHGILIDPFYPMNPALLSEKETINKFADKSQAIFLTHGYIGLVSFANMNSFYDNIYAWNTIY